MEEKDKQEQGENLSPEILKRAMKAFKKRLKLTSLDEDSRLGRGTLSGGLKVFVQFKRLTSFRLKCGRNCADRASSAAVAMVCM